MELRESEVYDELRKRQYARKRSYIYTFIAGAVTMLFIGTVLLDIFVISRII